MWDIVLCVMGGLILILLIYILMKLHGQGKGENGEALIRMEQMKEDMQSQQKNLRQELTQTVQESIQTLGKTVSENQMSISEMQQKSLSNYTQQSEERFKTFSAETTQKLESMRGITEKQLGDIREDNNKRLDEMRQIVDEKLQKTINERMTESFKLVNERLEQVYKGLGEMQSLANGVGDLKKVLTNVKTRGILGEIQLGAILEEIMSSEQYEQNVATKRGSKNVVEYAIKMPVDDGGHIYLPIDSKFPGDTYSNLRNAYESGNPEEIQTCVKVLLSTIKTEAKEIRDKYIDPPNTTEFAIMFLPFEGLYAEVVNRGMIEVLQREYRVNLAGPSTMAALLNSLQMGFKAFAIQKRSSEVWSVLGAVKTEFDKFESVLQITQQRLNQANDELDKLIGVRTRQMQRKLKNVTQLGETESVSVLELDQEEAPEELT